MASPKRNKRIKRTPRIQMRPVQIVPPPAPKLEPWEEDWLSYAHMGGALLDL